MTVADYDVVALWPERWPVIALQSCIDEVDAAPPELRHDVRMSLPCSTCPESSRCLTGKRREVGPLLYDREIMTQPRGAESSLFPLELWRRHGCLLDDEPCVPHWHKPIGTDDRYVIVTGWDLAWSESVGGDWLVAFTAVADRKTGLRRILDIERWRGLTFREQVALIESTHHRWQTDLVVIESDAAQAIWPQVVAETTNVPVLPHKAGGGGPAGSAKRDLRLGVPSLLVVIEQGKWHVPRLAGSRHQEHVDAFLGECEAFSVVDGRLESVGEHDDTVMAWWHAEYGVRRLLGSQMGAMNVGIVAGRRR